MDRPFLTSVVRRRGVFGLTWSRGRLPLAVVALCLAAATVAQASVPSLTAAVTRKNHAGTNYDIPLIARNAGTVTSLNAIEPRIVASVGLTVVLTFDQPVNAGTATISRSGSGAQTSTVPVAGAATFNNNQMVIPLTGLVDNQLYTVTAQNVAATDGSGTLATAPSVTFRTIQGDTTCSGSVNSADVGKTKFYAGLPLSGESFMCDVNANGSITSADVGAVKFTAGGTGGILGGSAAVNNPPTVGTVADMTISNDNASSPVGFSVNDAESDPSTLGVSAASDNPTLIPNNPANIILGGTGTSRTISLQPAVNQTGTCKVTISVGDGIGVTTTSFNVTVTNGVVLYVASLTPQSGAASTGSGSATLQVSGDQTYATLRFSYSNLTGPKNAEHIHMGAANVNGPILYDIDTPAPPSPPTVQPDGSYKWVFAQSGNNSVQDQLSAIASGNTYINIHTAAYPNGEIRGQFLLVQGSQNFTPPAAPPALPTGPATPADAVRFLQQATFGATISDVRDLVKDSSNNALTAYSNWIDKQADTAQFPQTNTLANFKALVGTNQDGAASPSGMSYAFNPTVCNVIWSAFLSGNDQLRQRVAYAYSQIFVISDQDDNLDGHPAALANWHDMLASNAFGRFYIPDPTMATPSLLRDVTLSPVMGQYLNMRGNLGPTTSKPGNTPNENYAREILQLFSIGLNWLQPDGTLKLDPNGLPIPTYSQTTITNFAHVFTGWNQGANVVIPTLAAGVTTNNNEGYINNMVVTASNHSILAKNLLSYDPTNPAAYQTAIAANSAQTTASCNIELDKALTNVFNHPNVGPFMARRLIQRLVCSNPSPAYVYRVAQVFNDNGSGVRGDMKAVIKAVLLDYEARSTSFLPNYASGGTSGGTPGYGKIREPVLRASQIIRAFHPQSKSVLAKPTGVTAVAPLRLSQTDPSSLGQTPYRAPTVFNFYEPDFADAGIIASAGLVSPEMEIETESTTIDQHNTIYTGIFSSNYVPGGTSSYGWPGSDVLIDLNATDAAWADPVINLGGTSGPLSEQGLCATDAGVDVMIARCNLLLMANQMPVTTKVIPASTVSGSYASFTYNMPSLISVQVKKTAATSAQQRARSVLRLVVSSPQFTAQR